MVLRIPSGVRTGFRYRAITFFGRRFHAVPLPSGLVTPCGRSYNPPLLCFHKTEVWAVPRSLAATDGIAVAFSSSRY